MSTLSVPTVPSSPKDDAAQLHRAFKGFGCDTAAVVNILAHRDAMQRAQIQHEYKKLYSEDMIKRLVSELSGDLETAIVLWMHNPAERDATILRQGLETKNMEAANDIICSRTPSQIQHFKQIYASKFGVPVELDIERSTSGDHRKLLLAYIRTPRSEQLEVDKVMAQNDAKELYKAGEKKIGTDEKTFIRIFSEKSRAHLHAINCAYTELYGNTLKKAVESETSGHFAKALLTILQCSDNPATYFAKMLSKAMKGLGTDEARLTRIIVTRTELDMKYIKAEYFRLFNKTLNDAVSSETSGNYKNFLLSLMGPNN